MKFSTALLWFMYKGEACPPQVNPGRWAAMLKQIKTHEVQVDESDQEV